MVIDIAEIDHHPLRIETTPFKHIFVEDFFRAEFHQQLCAEFNRIKSTGLSEKFLHNQLSRFGGYDAYFWLLPPSCGYPLSFFYSREWKNYFEALFDIPLTDDVVAEFHHHSVNSSDGFVHNDYNISCFVNESLTNGINPWYYQCNYDPKFNDMEAGQVIGRMRSIAIIYYFNNEEWQQGDGGETGLFTGYGIDPPECLIPPRSNSLLAFEVSPDSYHGFLSNSRIERNSLIMWFHSEKELKIARHNNTQPVAYGDAT